MEPLPRKSFSEICLIEAAARQVQVELRARDVSLPCGEATLQTRVLALLDGELLVLATPRHGAQKVALPIGTTVEMVLAMGGCVLRCQTQVKDHCLHPVSQTRRVEAILLHRPPRLDVVNRRREPRVEYDPQAAPILVDLWGWDDLVLGHTVRTCKGRLANWSQNGMGILTRVRPPVAVGESLILRLEDVYCPESRLYRAILRHCTEQPSGQWMCGMSDTQMMQPGQAVSIVERLSRH